MKKLLPILFFLLSFQAFAQEEEEKALKFDFKGYLKYMQTVSISHIDSNFISDNLIHNRLEFSAKYKKNLSAELHIRNRLFYGETVSINPFYADIMAVDTGLVDASFLIADKPSFFILSQIDRAFVNYKYKKWEITAGRQRINWGQTFAWNPNDLFNSYSWFDFDYEEKPGSDAVRVQYYSGNTGRVEIAASIDSAKHLTAAALWLFNKKQFDIQVLGGIYKSNDFTFGLGFTGNVLMGSLRGEGSYFHPKDNFGDSSGVFLATLGYDYMLKNGTMLQVEALYNQEGENNGRFNINSFYNLNLSAKNLSVSRWSYFFNAMRPLSPLINAQLGVMYYPGIQSFFAGPGITVSVSQNVDFMLMAYHFREFAPSNGTNRFTMVFGRFGWSF